ncbi:hypothetical protein SISNIDRAFT_458936, partial [Sistotremastrum niveocremeum HHB9708]
MVYSSLFYHYSTRNPEHDVRNQNHAIDVAQSPQACDITAHIQYLEQYPYPIDGGGCSDIYKADFDGRSVAVKVMRDIRVKDRRNRESLARKIGNEIKVWSFLQHQNILPFLGFCFFPVPSNPGESELTAQLSLVSPWMKHGTAPKYLQENPAVDRLHL